jgi:hypothetical protein
MFGYIQEVLIMTTAFAIRTLIEIVAVLFVIFGVLHEQKFIDFEDKVIRFIAKRIYLRKRKKAIARKRAAQQARRQRERELETQRRAKIYRYVA